MNNNFIEQAEYRFAQFKDHWTCVNRMMLTARYGMSAALDLVGDIKKVFRAVVTLKCISGISTLLSITDLPGRIREVKESFQVHDTEGVGVGLFFVSVDVADIVDDTITFLEGVFVMARIGADMFSPFFGVLSLFVATATTAQCAVAAHQKERVIKEMTEEVLVNAGKDNAAKTASKLNAFAKKHFELTVGEKAKLAACTESKREGLEKSIFQKKRLRLIRRTSEGFTAEVEGLYRKQADEATINTKVERFKEVTKGLKRDYRRDVWHSVAAAVAVIGYVLLFAASLTPMSPVVLGVGGIILAVSTLMSLGSGCEYVYYNYYRTKIETK